MGEVTVPIDPALARLGDALAAGGVRWAVLRGAIDRPGDGDLDVLVHPADVEAFRRGGAVGRISAPASVGPRAPPLPPGSRARRLVAPRRRDGLRFAGGRVDDTASSRPWNAGRRTGATPARRRRGVGAPATPPAGPLHPLGTRTGCAARRCGGAGTSGPIAAELASVLPSGWSPERLRGALVADDPAIADVRRRVRDGLRRRTPEGRLERQRRRWRSRIGARLRKPMTAVRRSGPSVALLGPDGAGKSALITGLLDAFPLPVRTAYLGLYPAGARHRRSQGPRVRPSTRDTLAPLPRRPRRALARPARRLRSPSARCAAAGASRGRPVDGLRRGCWGTRCRCPMRSSSSTPRARSSTPARPSIRPMSSSAIGSAIARSRARRPGVARRRDAAGRRRARRGGRSDLGTSGRPTSTAARGDGPAGHAPPGDARTADDGREQPTRSRRGWHARVCLAGAAGRPHRVPGPAAATRPRDPAPDGRRRDGRPA